MQYFAAFAESTNRPEQYFGVSEEIAWTLMTIIGTLFFTLLLINIVFILVWKKRRRRENEAVYDYVRKTNSVHNPETNAYQQHQIQMDSNPCYLTLSKIKDNTEEENYYAVTVV